MRIRLMHASPVKLRFLSQEAFTSLLCPDPSEGCIWREFEPSNRTAPTTGVTGFKIIQHPKNTTHEGQKLQLHITEQYSM